MRRRGRHERRPAHPLLTAAGLGVAAMVLITSGVVAAYNWSHSTQGAVSATQLRTEYLSGPLGIDATAPRLSWIPSSSIDNQIQRAYQIQVATSSDDLSAERDLVWDTGRVVSDQSWDIRYAGSDLGSGLVYHWRVRLWDGVDEASAWSEPTIWQMGLLDEAAWGDAQWISASRDTAPAAVLLRHDFDVSAGTITRATLTVAGLGFNVPYLNGARVSDAEMTPAWTDYSDRIEYVTYDVTQALLGGGANTLGVALAGGWYHPNSIDSWDLQSMPYVDRECLRLRLDVDFANGDRESVVSDASWTWATGDVTYASVRGGEDIDHTRDPGQWTTPGAEISGFAAVAVGAAPLGSPSLVAAAMPAERQTSTVATSMRKTSSGYLYTLEENVAATLTVTLTGTTGTRVRLQVGEGLDGGRVDPSWNSLNDKVLDGRWQQVNLTLGSSETETFTTTFTYFSGLYVDLVVTSGKLSGDPELAVSAVHTDLATSGTFTSSDSTLNTLHSAFLRTYLNNVHGYPMDCPQRERMGYGGDAGMLAESALLNFDGVTVYEKWMTDFLDAQGSDGNVPFTVPANDAAPSAYWWSPWWGNAIITIPVDLYEATGDTQVLDREYEGMRAYVDYLLSRMKSGLWADDGFPPDHEAVDHGDSKQFNTLGVAAALGEFVEVATILGHDDDAAAYQAHWTTVRDAFNNRWFDSAKDTYARDRTGSSFRRAPQSVLATALATGIVPDGSDDGVWTSLVADIENPVAGSAYANHIITGIVGTRYLFEMLTDHHASDIAYRLLTQDTYPGILPGVLSPGGTLYERIADDSLSHDHPMFGSYDAWFYRGLAGLNAEDIVSGGPLRVSPDVIDQLDWVEATESTVRGPATSRWERLDAGVRYTITVPVGASAEVSVVAAPNTVTLDGSAATTTVDPTVSDRQTLELSSGTHIVDVA